MMDLEDIRTLDLFGGTGSISYELASRGAGDMTIVEKDGGMIEFIKKTAGILGISEQLHIVRGDAFKFVQQCREQYDLIFADPPYALPELQQLPELVLERKLLLPGGLFILEHGPRNDFQQHPQFMRSRNYGETTFTFFLQPEAV
jgi:16S rRNA (guanine(966)-N(2))-methyltransferase RsmD